MSTWSRALDELVRERGPALFGYAYVLTGDSADAVATSVAFHEAILALPPRERACIVLRYLEDKPVGAIASELGLATGTVKRYLSDAVAALRASADIDFTADEKIAVVSHSGGNS
ncbi:sigma factor-like helix-turn-helix DNA-binding protein [Demequina lutea]|uniref:DNA-directed RNA polymerase specialized sigma24 family protein n=1 Tax=Demequina lutea TaxID=431489 RepID=A0A7Y9Z8S1_9MICO|nr:sigma factor-like helix-turn-helix DNA-binding protein [Demequina lutea]NYI40879.1 DNA-directed RNA polymerase specialized sigma24 family protein [Demequina lutea]